MGTQKHCQHCGRWVGNPNLWCVNRDPCRSLQAAADAAWARWKAGRPNGWDLYLYNRFGGQERPWAPGY